MKINKNEMLVLKAIEIGHGNTGGDFTYFEDVWSIKEIKKVMTQNQLKGYFSVLVQKGLITIDEEFEQVNFNKKVIEFLPKIEETCELYV